MGFEDWKVEKLKNLTLKIGSGATPKGGKESYKESGISFIRSQNVLNHTFTKEGLVYIDEDQANKLNNVIVEEEDVLLNITGDSVCRCCIVPSEILPARVNQHVCIIRCDPKKILPHYLKSYLNSPYMQSYMLSLAYSGGTRAALTKGMIENFDIPVPSIGEQSKIVSLLFSIEKKIELNNQINKNLEEMAQAIFKSWFVDFEPFQDGELVESELGLIPRGWEIKKIEEVCLRVNSGGTPKRSNNEFYNGSILWLKTKELTDGFVFDTEEKITEDAVLSSSAKFFPKNTVLIALYGATVGKLGILTRDTTFNQATCGMVVDEKYICHEYLYLTLLLNRDFIKSLATGSAQQNLSVSIIKNMKIIIPEPDVMRMFTNTVRPLYEKIKANQYESICLKNLRDTLLPKLMSGEIRVPL
jgi:type I restriction enzyme, S subunit